MRTSTAQALVLTAIQKKPLAPPTAPWPPTAATSTLMGKDIHCSQKHNIPLIHREAML